MTPFGSSSSSSSTWWYAALLACCSTVARASASSAGSGDGTSSRRANHGSDSPWMKSVPATTVNAMSSSTSRCGVSSGITNAAASVTTPRMPAQPRMNV